MGTGLLNHISLSLLGISLCRGGVGVFFGRGVVVGSEKAIYFLAAKCERRQFATVGS
jgi:hypothetical protein